MVTFSGLVGKLLMASLILLPLMTFIVTIQDNNNSSQQVSDNNIFNESFGELTGVIENATVEAGEKYDVFNQETPKSGVVSIVLFGIVSVGKTFSNIIFGFLLAIIKLPLVVFGVPSTIYNLVITWLTIVVIVSVWLLYKFGSG